jgi:hypothetical protein
MSDSSVEGAPERDGATPPSATRIVLIALVAFAAAIAVHSLLGAIGIGADNAFRLLVTPAIGAVIVYVGLSGYHTAGRLRLAAMVGILLLVFSGAA